MKAAGPMYRRSTLQARVPSPEKPGVKGAQSCPTVCDPRDYTAHGILQSRVLEPVAFPFSGDLPNPGIELRSPALQADSLPAEPQGKLKNTGREKRIGARILRDKDNNKKSEDTQ